MQNTGLLLKTHLILPDIASYIVFVIVQRQFVLVVGVSLNEQLWGKFLNWGQIPFDFHDWAEITAPRVAFLRDAMIKGITA